jgi:hypothetical protein
LVCLHRLRMEEDLGARNGRWPTHLDGVPQEHDLGIRPSLHMLRHGVCPNLHRHGHAVSWLRLLSAAQLPRPQQLCDARSQTECVNTQCTGGCPISTPAHEPYLPVPRCLSTHSWAFKGTQ